MLNTLLRRFPTPPVSTLLLASDPDGLLNDEQVLTELRARGYTLIAETDPIRLRYRYAHSTPPCLIITPGPLNQLPYDLWQRGEHITLALHEFFPYLAYPLLQALTPPQRTRLFQAPPPAVRLGETTTLDYLFRYVFDLDLNVLGDPLTFITWLSASPRREPLQDPFRAALRTRLHTQEAFRDLPIDELLDDPEYLSVFLQDQWLAYLQKRGLLGDSEARIVYLADFDHPRWQDLLPRWLRTGLLRPVPVESAPADDDWMAPGLLVRTENAFLKRLRLLIETLEETLAPAPPQDFTGWAALAVQWAEITTLQNHPQANLPAEELQDCIRLQTQIDDAFPAWLERAYPSLAVKTLPEPHHLFHVPHYLAALRRKKVIEKVALIVLDGMALTDWQVLWEGWSARHCWSAEMRLLLAQVPTITAISRQALISGRRPDEFAATITHNREEPRHWERFWQNEGLGAHACFVTHDLQALPLLDDVQALCLIITTVDEIHHHALLGPQDAQSSLRHWRDHHAYALETTFETLLQSGFAVWLTSDHGYTVAKGIGQPREGLIVETRGLRARTYRDVNLAQVVQRDFPETYLWYNDGLLPADLWALIPQGHAAFAPQGEIHLTHGGLSLNEVFVPLVQLKTKTGSQVP